MASSLDQCLVGEALASRAGHEAIEPVQSVPLHVAVIQAEGKFVNVAAQVLFAGVVIDADQAALHDREHTFDAVGGHVIADVFAFAVVDGFVVEKQPAKATVNASLIGVQRRASGDVLVDFGVQGRHVGVLYRHRLHAALCARAWRQRRSCRPCHDRP